MVTILTNPNVGYDDSGHDGLFLLKKTMASLHWKNFEKVMYSELQSLIENDTWGYKNAP